MPFAVDRVECALEAMSLGIEPQRRIDPAPVDVRPLPARGPVPALAGGPVLMAGAASMRPQVLAGANLALLAAGTAATIYLWLRVFGADLAPIFPVDSASPAFERGTVAAAIDLTPPAPPESRPLPESEVGGGGSQPLVVSATPVSVTRDSDRSRPASRRSNEPNGRGQRNGGPVVRPSAPPPPPPPPAEPAPPRSAPVPTFPVPSSPPADRIPGPTLPGSGGGRNPGQPTLPSGGGRG
jgi:hypothetical protein